MLGKILKYLLKGGSHHKYSSSDAWKHHKHKKYSHLGHKHYKKKHKSKSFFSSIGSFFSS